MSDELIEDMANAETQRTIAQIIAQIHEAEAMAAKGKNKLVKMGYGASDIQFACQDYNENRAAKLLMSICPKPERAFTEEIF